MDSKHILHLEGRSSRRQFLTNIVWVLCHPTENSQEGMARQNGGTGNIGFFYVFIGMISKPCTNFLISLNTMSHFDNIFLLFFYETVQLIYIFTENCLYCCTNRCGLMTTFQGSGHHLKPLSRPVLTSLAVYS